MKNSLLIASVVAGLSGAVHAQNINNTVTGTKDAYEVAISEWQEDLCLKRKGLLEKLQCDMSDEKREQVIEAGVLELLNKTVCKYNVPGAVQSIWEVKWRVFYETIGEGTYSDNLIKEINLYEEMMIHLKETEKPTGEIEYQKGDCETSEKE